MATQNAPVLREGLCNSLITVVTSGLASYQAHLFQFFSGLTGDIKQSSTVFQLV
jgi:hypothetical protein